MYGIGLCSLVKTGTCPLHMPYRRMKITIGVLHTQGRVPLSRPRAAVCAPCKSQVKTGWRTATVRPARALDTALRQILATVTALGAHSWFKRCGDILR
jgi:hypothetical protein